MKLNAWIIGMVCLIVGFAAGAFIGIPQLGSPAPASQTAATQRPPAASSVFGTVTAKSPSSVTLRLTDGTTQTFTINQSTKFYAPPQSASLSDLVVGGLASVAVSGSSTTAQTLTIVPPPAP